MLVRVGVRSPGSAHLASVHKKENGSTAVHTHLTHTRTHHQRTQIVTQIKLEKKRIYRYAIVRMASYS